jgi:putative endonuclease
MNKNYYVYILSNSRNSVLYVGITSNLVRRTYEHKNHLVEGFTDKYNVTKLVYLEVFDDPKNAILREKKLKRWHRSWKQELIEKDNPNYQDLYPKIA